MANLVRFQRLDGLDDLGTSLLLVLAFSSFGRRFLSFGFATLFGCTSRALGFGMGQQKGIKKAAPGTSQNQDI